MTNAPVSMFQKAREAFLNAAPYLEERTWLEDLLETLTQKVTSIEDFEASVAEVMEKEANPARKTDLKIYLNHLKRTGREAPQPGL